MATNFTDEQDEFKITDPSDPLQISDATEQVTVTDGDLSVTVQEVTDSVTVSDTSDTVTVSDTDDVIEINFSEVLAPVINNITSTAEIITGIAAENLGAHRIVVAIDGDIGYADNTDISHSGIVLGITTQAVVSGASVDVTIQGEVTEGSWNWTLNMPIFLTENGLMTQTVVSTGFILQVGYPTSYISMIIDIKTAIVLST